MNFHHVKFLRYENQTCFSFSYLRLDVDLLGSVFVEPGHVDLTVKVSNVTDDGIILHVLKVAEGKIQTIINMLLCKSRNFDIRIQYYLE